MKPNGVSDGHGAATEGSTLTYMVTIKNNTNKFVSIDELMDLYNWLVKRIQGADWHSLPALELDSLKRLHLHAVFRRNKKVNPSSYRRPGWSVHFQICDDPQRAVNYINKYRQNIDEKWQREWESLANFQNLFNNDTI